MLTKNRDERHLVLSSNVKDERNIKPGHFFNKLSNPLQLDDDALWLVGIRKIIYINNPQNVVDSWLVVKHHAQEQISFRPQLPFTEISQQFNFSYSMKDHETHASLEMSFNSDDSKPKDEFRFVVILWSLGTSDHVYEKMVKVTPDMKFFSFNFEEGYYTAGTAETPHLSPLAINKLFVNVNCWKKTKQTIEPNYYPKIEDLLDQINSLLYPLRQNNTLEITYDRLLDRCILVVTSSLIKKVSFSPELQSILGFEKSHIAPIPFQAERNYAQRQPNLFGCRYPLHVLTNIINSFQVGDNFLPTLELISLNTEPVNFGNVVEHIVDSPIYHEVILNCQKALEEVEILIVDEQGRMIEFENNDSKIVIVLHFIKMEKISI